MVLSTTWLGLALPHPFLAGASPLTLDLDGVRRLEDAGSAAIVMHSLFEEQAESRPRSDPSAFGPGKAASAFAGGPDEYLEQVRRIRAAVGVPVIASLNATRPGPWMDVAGRLAEAGAAAVELNVYFVATDPEETSLQVEDRILGLVKGVVDAAGVPVAVKLSPFWTALASFARRLDGAGVKGLVLFNRFYQPDIDLDERRVSYRLQLSEPGELLLRLRWLAILSERVSAGLAASGGVREPTDATKAILAGAHVVQMVSALLEFGPEHLRTVREGVRRWMVEREIGSLDEIRGTMGLVRCPDPTSFERGSYLHVLEGWRGAL